MTATAAGFALNGITQAIQTLYGIVGDINTFIDKHIEEMKASNNSTIARTGRVIEGAKFGFGIGYMVPIAIIAVGQLLLGNPFFAAKVVATAATFTNPIAMTCAAVGAIYYGWAALSEVERQEIIEKLSHGLEVGIELIKAIIGFVINKTKELLTSEYTHELKKFIADAAETFGRTLADVTGSIADKIKGAADKTKDMANDAYHATADAAGKIADTVKEKINKKSPK